MRDVGDAGGADAIAGVDRIRQCVSARVFFHDARGLSQQDYSRHYYWQPFPATDVGQITGGCWFTAYCGGGGDT